MLQRVQTLFLLAAILVNVASLFVPLWEYNVGDTTETISGMAVEASGLAAESANSQNFTASPFHIAFFALNILIALFIGLTIFQYKNRTKQASWVQIAIILLLLEIVSLVLLTQRGPYFIVGESKGGMAALGFALPIVAVFLLWLGKRNIKADEELVRSVDRLR